MPEKKANLTTSKDQISSVDHNVEFKECFIITPIGSIGSDTFNKTEGLIKSVLEPILNDFGFKAVPAHHINDSGSINKQIINRLVNCELAIANLTEVNPNVMYELAIRHSFGKKVIILAEHGTKLPFDINDQRTIFYYDTMLGVEVVKPQLRKMIEVCLAASEKEENISNPIYDSVKQIAAINQLPVEQQDILSIIMNKIDSLESKNKYNSKRDLAFSSGLTKRFDIKARINEGNADMIPNVKELLRMQPMIKLLSEITISQPNTKDIEYLEFSIGAQNESAVRILTSSLMNMNYFIGVSSVPAGEVYIL